MPPIPERDPKARWLVNWGPPRHTRNLVAADIGADLAPMYASALRISVGPSVAAPLTIRVVAAGEPVDTNTTDLVISTTGDRWEPISVRRIVSINGVASIPAGVSIILGWG